METIDAPQQEQEAADEVRELDETLSKLQRWSKAIDAHYGEWITESERSFDLVAGHHWTEDDKAAFQDLNRKTVTFNRIGVMIDAVCGTEILSRQAVTYYPRTLGDTGVNEVLTRGAEWIRDRTNAPQQESAAARDCFICGLGYTETRLDYEQDPRGRLVIEAGLALKCLPDPQARQPCADDARYLRYRNEMSRDEYEECYPGEASAYDSEGTPRRTSNDPRDDYDKKSGKKDEDTVTVDLFQWFEVIHVYRIPRPDGMGTMTISEDQYTAMREAAEAAGRNMPRSLKMKNRVYWEAIISGNKFLQEPRELPHRKFRFKFMTGKRDNTQGTWYGVVRPLDDPQKWLNNLYSMALHILRHNAKGGLMMERGADGGESENPIEDQKRFEQSYARSDEITWVAADAISGNRIKQKEPPRMPEAIGSLFSQAVEAMPAVSGVSQEMMGLVEQNQPGVVEHQRKQAGFTILATFFDSFKLYRKLQGELMLPMMRDLGPETLVRIVGEDGDAKYVQLAMDPDVEEYDVIVSDAPAGPNQKERNWALFMQIYPGIKDQMSPEVWVEILRYSPFPEAFVQKITQMMKQGGDDEKAQLMEKLKMAMAQLEGQERQAGIAKTQAETANINADTQQKQQNRVLTLVRPDPMPQVSA